MVRDSSSTIPPPFRRTEMTEDEGVLLRIRTGETYICVGKDGIPLPKERLVSAIQWIKDDIWIAALDFYGKKHVICPDHIIEFFVGCVRIPKVMEDGQ